MTLSILALLKLPPIKFCKITSDPRYYTSSFFFLPGCSLSPTFAAPFFSLSFLTYKSDCHFSIALIYSKSNFIHSGWHPSHLMILLPAYPFIFICCSKFIQMKTWMPKKLAVNIPFFLGVYTFVWTFSHCLECMKVLLGNSPVFKNDLNANSPWRLLFHFCRLTQMYFSYVPPELCTHH